jgi:hypothetical protein
MSREKNLVQLRATWEKRIKTFNESNQGVVEFARAHNLTVSQFYYWKNKFAPVHRKNRSTDAMQVNAFAKVVPSSSNGPQDLPDPEWLARFIKALR